MTTAGDLTFTTAMWVVDRVHRNTAVRRTNPQPASPTRLTNSDVFMISIRQLTNRSAASSVKQANFTARHLHLAVVTFFRHQLSKATSRTSQIATMARLNFDIVNQSTNRNRRKGKVISGLDIG